MVDILVTDQEKNQLLKTVENTNQLLVTSIFFYKKIKFIALQKNTFLNNYWPIKNFFATGNFLSNHIFSKALKFVFSFFILLEQVIMGDILVKVQEKNKPLKTTDTTNQLLVSL
jgi:hypothetical protein